MDGILLVGHQLWIWDIKFEKIRCQNPATKSQDFVNILGMQNPTWAKFLEFIYFYM